MSTDSEDEVLSCTPLQRCRSQITSSEVDEERKPTPRIFLTQTEKYKNYSSSSMKFRSPLKTSLGKGKGRPKLNKSVPKTASDDLKPLSLAKRHFLYGVSDDSALGAATSNQNNPSYSQSHIKRKWQWEEEDQKYRGNNLNSVKQEDWENSVCPHCMMPWDTYNQDSKLKQFHIDECLDRDLSSCPDCEHGLNCKEILENHFWTFNHYKLATLFGMKLNPSDDSGYEDPSMDGSLCVYKPGIARRADCCSPKLKMVKLPCSNPKELNARPKIPFIDKEIVCLVSDDDDDAPQTDSVPLFDDCASVQSYKNNNGEKSKKAEYSESNSQFSDNDNNIDCAHDSNKNNCVQERIKCNTPKNKAEDISEMARKNCAKFLTNNTVNGCTIEDSTSKNFSALIDSEDVPCLELKEEVLGSVGDVSSEDHTILFNRNGYTLESTPCIDVEENNISHNSTLVFQGITSDEQAHGDLSDNSTATVMSQSLITNVSRQLFKQTDNNTNDHQEGTHILTNSECLTTTESLELTWEGDGNQLDKTLCSQADEREQIETARKNMDTETSSTFLPRENDRLSFNTHISQTQESESISTEEQRETAERTDEAESVDLGGTLGECQDGESRNLAGTLESCEDDELLVNLVEMAVEKYIGGVVDKVREQKGSNNKSPLKAASQTVDQDEDKATTSNHHGQHHGLNQGKKGTAFRNSCIHFHFHIDSPSPKKGGGQTSILNYFQRKSNKMEEEVGQQSSGDGHKCQCGRFTSKNSGNTSCFNKRARGSNKRKGVNEWQEVMARMKQKRTVLPSVSGSSVVSEVRNTVTSHVQGRGWGGQHGQRKCPFYKYIQDTNVVVDAFCYGSLEGVDAYFLSHFHYDHYRGLTKTFAHPVYCSFITAQLVKARLKVKEQHIYPLPMCEPQKVCDFEVTLLDANHCPGSVMFLFKLKTGKTILHTGDFRAHPRMESYPEFWNTPNINTVFLDTTYCNPVYDFPSQEEVLEACTAIAQHHMADNPNTLIVVGSYTIGKERVFKAIAESLDCRVWASGDKRRILSYLDDPEIQARITTDKKQAKVHVLSMGQLSHKKLLEYITELHPLFNVVVAFKPSGWEHSAEAPTSLESITPKQIGKVSVYGMPYSEHSSFQELRRFVEFIQPDRIIPTVNVGNANMRRMMEGHFNDWRKAKRTFNKGHINRK